MMGSKARIFTAVTVVSLDELVPANHFYRHLDRVVDLSFVRDLVKKTYAHAGRPSIDPVVFFKLQLVMFFDDIRSERLLMHLAADRLSVRWYVGYNLDEPLPDHSSLTRIRERYGVELFRRFFEAIVDQCQQAGLVWGKELYVDATKVNANASMESVRPRFAVEAHLANLFAAEPGGPAEEAQQVATQDEPASSEPSPQEVMAAPVELPTVLSAEQRAVLTQQNQERHDWIERQGRPDREVMHGSYQRVAD
jgi:transposase